MRKINKKWFIDKIEEREESLRSFAPKMGKRLGATLDHTMLSRKLSGNRAVTLEDVEALAELLEVKTVEVLKAFGMKIRG